jgi:hypothetical protein
MKKVEGVGFWDFGIARRMRRSMEYLAGAYFRLIDGQV